MKLNEKIEQYRTQNLFRDQRVFDNSLINFTSNDYLHLAQDQIVKKAFIQGVDIYGLGSGSSAMVVGYTKAHQQLEQKFAEFLNCDSAVLFNSGYHANLGVITALISKDTFIIADKLCHASIIDGMKLSGAKYKRYTHQNLTQAETLLSEPNTDKILVTESIFSMEGNITPVDKIAKLSAKYKSALIIDDAHAIGILGNKGRGITEYYNLTQDEITCLVVPLGKAFASIGAIVAGKKQVIEAIRQFARTYIYTTAIPPAIPCATLEVLKKIEQETWRREKLNELVQHFIQVAGELHLNLSSKDPTPIKSIIIGNNLKALEIQDYLKSMGFFVSCIRPPTVPINSARIRISINCCHNQAQISQLLRLIAEKYYE